jgi:hypothetical protein
MLTPDAFVLIRPNAWSCEGQLRGPDWRSFFGEVMST